MNKGLAIFLILLAIDLGFTCGAYLGDRDGYEQGRSDGFNDGYKSGYHIEYRDIRVVETKTVIRETEVPVEVVVKEPLELCEFSSLEELKVWLTEDDTDEVYYIFCDESGRAEFKWSERWDCDDYAFQLQRRALEQGYLMSVEITKNQTHLANSTPIGNKIYIIEPQTDEIIGSVLIDPEAER